MIKKNKNYKIMFRPRGILPEESYYRYRSMLRKKVLDIIEYNAIKDSDCFCYIARTQQTHFLSKYYYNKKIMNSIIVHNYLSYGEILKDKNRTGRIRIVYSGGFSKWQKVEDIFKLVSRIIKENINIDFYIYTFKSNFSIAEQYIKKYNLDGYAFIENHEPEKLIHELSKNDIGILLRDSNIINLTASPFKVMDYLNARLGVILTENVGDYSLSLNGKEYAYMLNLIGSEVPGYELDRVVNFIKSYIEKKQKMLEVIEHDLVNQFNLDNEIYLLNNFILNIFE